MNGFDPDAAAVAGGLFGLPHPPEEARVVIVPVPWEATTSYGGGTSDGPAAILAASAQVDLFDVDTGRPWEGGIAMLPMPSDVRSWSEEARILADPVIAAGGPIRPELALAIERIDALGEQLNGWVERQVEHWIAEGKLVGVVGGDHSVSFGSIAAHARRWPGLGVLHIDAHADLRVAYEGFEWSHASIMFNVISKLPDVARLVQVGIRDVGEREAALIESDPRRIFTAFDADLRDAAHAGVPFARVADRIAEALPPAVYVSFDIDGLDPSLCPSTGTPVPGGLAFGDAVGLLQALVRAGRRIVGFDLTEVAPGATGEWDGNVGARILYKLIGFALQSQGVVTPPGRRLFSR